MHHVIGYVRVSTDEQAESGAGLAAQRAAILAEAERRGWVLVEMMEDGGYSAKDLKRPGIQAALLALRQHKADTLVVAKLDRLSRSMLDFNTLLATAAKEHWALVALDLGVDTSTPSGEMMANVLATFAQFERRLISQRTKDALRQKRAEGVRLGRPAAIPQDVLRRIAAERDAGRTFAAIAAALNDDQVPTAQGGRRWYPSTVRYALGEPSGRSQDPSRA